MFPVDRIPDGSVGVPHHYYYLALAALLVILTVWDDHRGKEPLVSVAGIVAGLFSFYFVWPRYPQIGAVLSLAAPAVAILSILQPRSTWWRPEADGGWPLVRGVVAVFLLGGALDDAVEHAFGWPTPLDTLHGEIGAVASVTLAVLVFGAITAGLLTWERFAG